jgi:hypothetical protein
VRKKKEKRENLEGEQRFGLERKILGKKIWGEEKREGGVKIKN